MLKSRRNYERRIGAAGGMLMNKGTTASTWKTNRRNRMYLTSCVLMASQFHACRAFSSPPLPPPRSPGTAQSTISFLLQPPQQSTTRRQFPERQSNDNNDDGMYDGGECFDFAHYDGEYDFDFYDDTSSTPSKSLEGRGTHKTSAKDTLNDELHRWFEDRNQVKPILLTDLLKDDDGESDAQETKESPLIPVEDYVWFEPTLREIELKYDKRREQLEMSLDHDRLSTPRTVPMEANRALIAVLQEEMENEIREQLQVLRKERKARNKQRKKLLRLRKQQNEEKLRKSKMELLEHAKRELSSRDPILANSEKPMDEDSKLSRKQALYVAAQAIPTNSNVESLDFWAMDRVEESLLNRLGQKRNRQQFIEEKLTNMRELMEVKLHEAVSGDNRDKASIGAFKPDDYADWKKYQEIKAFEKANSVDGVVDEALVRRKLLDYKEFMARQELTLQAFDEEEKELQHDLEEIRKFIPEERKRQKRNFADVVADINRKALKSLEQVLEKRRSEDGEGTEELEQRIAKLRESLEAVNYVDVKLIPKVKEVKFFKNETIDFTDIFPSQAARLRGDKDPASGRKEQHKPVDGKKRSSRSQEFADLDSMFRNTPPLSIQQDRAFDFQESSDNFFYSASDDAFDDDYDEWEDEPTVPPPPPKTAFFSSLLDSNTKENMDDDISAYVLSESDINKPAELRSTSLLGTFEEQRMKNVFRQAGATTEEEQERLRASMEEFQRYQEEVMKKYEQMDETDLGYDIADVLTEDGDIDSEMVLSYIKTKPAVPKPESIDPQQQSLLAEASTSVVTSTAATVSTSEISSEEAAVVVERLPSGPKTTELVNEASGTALSEGVRKSVPTPFFSGKSDINAPSEERETSLLGSYEEQAIRNLIRETGLKDKAEQEKFKDEYAKFLKYQKDTLEKFEEEEKLAVSADESEPEQLHSTAYVESLPTPFPLPPIITPDNNVIELGPKPSAAERKRRLAQGNLWQHPQEFTPKSSPERGSFLGQIEVGSESTDMASLQEVNEESEEDFEENQRRIEQALGIRRSKGIDIYDALGRRPGQMDYEEDFKRDDYEFPLRRHDVDLSSYQLRKEMMLDRKSISIMEVNSLMDMKDNLEVEGISPYMARVNKPFKEFGAIFRLEGVLVEISPLQYRAWSRVASKLNMKPPSRDDVRLASVQTADYAVRRIFHWTNNYMLCREIAEMHGRFLKEEIKSALDKGSVSDEREDSAIVQVKSDSVANAQPVVDHVYVDPKSERQALTKSMYKIFAKQYGFREPTESELEIAAQLTPKAAVEDIFDWCETKPVDSVLSTLKQIYDIERRKMNQLKQKQSESNANPNDVPFDFQNDEVRLEVTEGAISWIGALLDVEMPCGVVSYLDEESVELIMNATGLASLIPAEKRVTSSNRYDRETYQQLGVCLRIDRRPDMCVVFDGNADALNAARDNEMKSVGITNVYPSYELLAADMTARNFEYLTAMNVRRLFGGRENQEPLLQVAKQEPSRPKRKVMTMYPDEERSEQSSHVDDDAMIYNEDQTRYFGDDKYFPRRSAPDDGVLYDDKHDADLFQ